MADALLPPRELNARYRYGSFTVWLRAEPQRLRLAARLDAQPWRDCPVQRLNPRAEATAPLILHAAEPAVPVDGVGHTVEFQAWHQEAGRESARVTVALTVRRDPEPIPPPTTIAATLLRQGTARVPELVEIRWTATTAVELLADGPKRGPRVIGHAEPASRRFLAENTRTLLPRTGGLYPVAFGVRGYRDGQRGPAIWSRPPLSLRAAASGRPTVPPTPDQAAGTAVALRYADLKAQVRAAVRVQRGTLSTQGETICNTALDRLLLRIKTVVMRGGRVTVDHVGAFAARWSPARTERDPISGIATLTPAQRNPAFVPSLGLKVGTQRGTILTDAEAKAGH